MENKLLSERLNALLSDSEIAAFLKRKNLLMQSKKLAIALMFVEEEGIEVSDLKHLSFFMEFLEKVPSEDFKEKYPDEKGIDGFMVSDVFRTQFKVLEAIKGTVDYIDQQLAVQDLNRKDKKALADKRALCVGVAGEILPYYVNNAYNILQSSGLSTKIYDEQNYYVWDLDQMFDGSNRLLIHEATFNNLPYYSHQTEKKYLESISKDAEVFLNMSQALFDACEQWLSRVFIEDEEKLIVNSNVRRFRRANRPANKNGELLPSYLDYLTDDGKIVPFEEFKKSATYRVFELFETEEEYNNFVKSNEFRSYVSYLETPLEFVDQKLLMEVRSIEECISDSEYALREGLDVMRDIKTQITALRSQIEKRTAQYKRDAKKAKPEEKAELKAKFDKDIQAASEDMAVLITEYKSVWQTAKKCDESIKNNRELLKIKMVAVDPIQEKLPSVMALEARKGDYRFYYSDSSDFVSPEDMAYEFKGYFPKEDIKLPAKEYALAKKVNNETVVVSRAQNEKALAIAKRIGAGALAFFIIANATATPINEIIKSIKEGIQHTSTPEEPEIPVEPIEPSPEEKPTYNNTEVRPEDEIRDNPAEKDEPVVDNVDENGDIVPELPPVEETPDENGDQVTESDPSYDQPDTEVPDENDINDKRDDESSDDEFFFD